MGRSPFSLEQLRTAFWAKVNKTEGCWLWLGSTRCGYGRVKMAGKMQIAHRVAWWLTHGAWPPLLRHKCDTPLCVRLDHLETGTTAENTQDSRERGRMCVGSRMYNAKMTDDSVRELRALRGTGWTYERLAARFGLGMATVQQIVTRKRWRHVPP